MSSPSDPDPSRPSAHEPDEPPAMSLMAAAGWAFGVTFAFFFLHSIAVSLRPGSSYDLVTRISCQAIAYLLGLFLILRVHAPAAGIRETIGLRATHPGFYPLAMLLGAAIEIPADALYEAIIRRWPTGLEDKFEEVYREASSPRRAVFAVLLVVAGPALEEILFRGALFRLLLKTHPLDLVMAATAALFAFAHLEWQIFLPIGLVGLALAFLRREAGSIVPSFLLHASFNGVSFALMALSPPGASDAPLPRVVVAAAVGVSLLLVAAIRLLGARSATAAHARELDTR